MGEIYELVERDELNKQNIWDELNETDELDELK